MPAWIGLFARRLLPVKERPRFLTTVHGLNSINAYSQVMTYGERVVAVSQCCRDYILKNYPRVPPEKISLIPHGIDHQFFSHGYQPAADWISLWREQYPQLEKRFVLLLPGRLTRLKGHFDFLCVVARLKEQSLPVHGLIVGAEDPNRQDYARSLRQRVADLGLTDEITFTGHRTDLREIMSVSGAVVSTSTKPESFGRTVLEALCLGKPTFGYNHGGVGEMLAQLYPSGAVSVGNHEELADRLAAAFRQELAPPPATHEYSLENMLDREIELYEQLVSD